MDECKHTMTQGRKGERGSWCMACEVKVYDVDERKCQDCTHSQKLRDGTICNKHLMSVTPDMNVTFKIADGTCWEAVKAPAMPLVCPSGKCADPARECFGSGCL